MFIKLCVCPFPFGIEGGMCDAIVLIPDCCLSIYIIQYRIILNFRKEKRGFLPNSLCKADKFVDFLTPSRLLQNRVWIRSRSGFP